MNKTLILIGFIALMVLSGCSSEKTDIECGYLASCPQGYDAIPFGFDCIKCNQIKVNNTNNNTWQLNLSKYSKGYWASEGYAVYVPPCCYPIECPQSINNPKNCTCEFMVKCGAKLE